MAEEKSTLQELRDAFARTKSALKKTEAQVERSTGVVIRHGLGLGSGFTAGALHERFGKMDERAGVRIIRVGGVNAGIMVGLLGLGGELMEVGGKYSEAFGAATMGIGAQGFGDQGRAFTRSLAKRKADRDAEKKNETPAASTAQTKVA